MPLGFGLFVVGWVCLLVVAFGFPYSTRYDKGFVALFSLVPWNLLSKGIQDLAAASAGGSQLDLGGTSLSVLELCSERLCSFQYCEIAIC